MDAKSLAELAGKCGYRAAASAAKCSRGTVYTAVRRNREAYIAAGGKVCDGSRAEPAAPRLDPIRPYPDAPDGYIGIYLGLQAPLWAAFETADGREMLVPLTIYDAFALLVIHDQSLGEEDQIPVHAAFLGGEICFWLEGAPGRETLEQQAKKQQG